MNDRRAYFESLAERWDHLQPSDRGEVLRRLLAPFASLLAESSSVVEVGTGTGALIPCLRERAPRARLVSFDLAHGMLRRARHRCPGAVLLQADAERLPFVLPQGSDRGFDLVVCHNTFPHFADKVTALLGLALALRIGGHLLILHDLSRERVNEIHRAGGEAIQNDLLPPGAETRQMLARVGFTALYVEDADEHYVACGRWAAATEGVETEIARRRLDATASA